ncbi:hypothetical protein PM082_006127 [Marasmius tenuissimus]|nr:hypothetical protein PM082_006127 [Marasmius tenuissimus]
MPTLSNASEVVLVTGANGFIATWTIGNLLKRGYTVRAAVRDESRGKHLLQTYQSYGDKLYLFAVGDMQKDGAFDKAVQGVDGVIHTAAQVNLLATDPKGIIDPAVKGVTGILNSAIKHGSQLKRVVFTSTCLTIHDFSTDDVTVSEADWNEKAVRECEEKGSEAHPLSMYSASKTLAEKAAWALYEENKNKISWDFTVVNLPWVVGPTIHEVTTPDTLNESTKHWYRAIVEGDFGGGPSLMLPNYGWADVRDVSEALARALEVKEAAGERIIICAGSPFVWQDWLDAANSLTPTPYRKIAKGASGTAHRGIKFDTSKERRILGLRFRTMEEVTRDVLTDYTRRGW